MFYIFWLPDHSASKNFYPHPKSIKNNLKNILRVKNSFDFSVGVLTIFQNGPFSKNEFSKHFLAKKLKFGQNTSQYAYFQILEKNCTIKKNKTIFGVKGIFNSFTQKWSPFFKSEIFFQNINIYILRWILTKFEVFC